MAVITLPWPPAVNNLFATVKSPKGLRRIPTRDYKAWALKAGVALLEQRPQPLKGKFHVHVTAYRPDNRRRDLDGLFKAPLDLLVKCGVVEDDSLAQSLMIAWSDAEPQKPGSIRVSVVAA